MKKFHFIATKTLVDLFVLALAFLILPFGILFRKISLRESIDSIVAHVQMMLDTLGSPNFCKHEYMILPRGLVERDGKFLAVYPCVRCGHVKTRTATELEVEGDEYDNTRREMGFEDAN